MPDRIAVALGAKQRLRKRRKDYDPRVGQYRSEKFHRWEDGSVLLPNGRALDPDTKRVRPVQPWRSPTSPARSGSWV